MQRDSAPARVPVPTHLVTGFLGAGKTSAVRSLLASRPPGSRWAVLVNELGSAGVDGALLAAAGASVVVREVAGGCICCSARVALQVGLARLLREVRPDRLLIEPTGLGHPAGIFDVLAQPGLAEAIELRTTFCLVDPRQFADPRFAASPIARDQMSLADVLVANKTDLAGPELTQRFLAAAHGMDPPKVAVVEARHGALDPALLDLAGPTKAPAVRAGAFGDPVYASAQKRGYASRGWIFPPEVIFDERRLRDRIESLLAGGSYLRAKGLFRVGRGWRALNHAGGVPVWSEIAYRRDSRFELIAVPGCAPDWSRLDAMLHELQVSAPGAHEATR